MNSNQIIIAIITLLTTILGGALISKKISNRRVSKTSQSGITVTGDKNKVIAGDDNSNSN